MELRKLALGAAVSTALMAAGCGDDGGTPDMPADVPDMGSCQPAQECTDPGTGDTYQFVIHRSALVLVPEGSSVANGFNLDCKVSDATGTRCDDRQLDYVSCDVNEQSCAPIQGIDNQLATLIPLAASLGTTPLASVDANCDGDIDEYDVIQTAINQRNLILLLELTGVSSFTNDDCIGLRLTVQAPPGEPDDGDCDQIFGADQTFVEDTEFVDVNTNGSIVDGRLVIATDSIPISLPLGAVNLDLNILNARIEGTISATGIEGGVIGGGISRAQMLALVGTFLPPEDGGDTSGLEAIVDSLTDLQPDTAGICQGLSMGITFEAATATF